MAVKNTPINLSVPVKVPNKDNYYEELYEELPEDNRFLRLKIYVMHTGRNLNNTYFDKNTVEQAKDTIKNIPVLAFVKENEDENEDFSGHEIRISITNNGVQEKYLGRPIGIVPEQTNYRYEELDGKEFVVVNAYIWKKYANEALDILERDQVKRQSMEIRVLDAYDDNGLYYITGYQYLGLTLLGDDYQEAMQGAKAEVYDVGENYFELIEEFKRDLLNMLNSEKGGSKVAKLDEKNKKKQEQDKDYMEDTQLENPNDEKYENAEQENDEGQSEQGVNEEEGIEDDGVGETDDKDDNEKNDGKEDGYSLTGSQFEKELMNQVEQIEMVEIFPGFELPRYFYIDYKEGEVYVEDIENWNIYSFNYSVNNDVVKVNVNTKKRKKIEFVDFVEGEDQEYSFIKGIVEKFKEKQGDIVAQYAKQKDKEIKDLKAEHQNKIKQMEEQYNEIKKEKDDLEEFKQEVEKAQYEGEIEELAESFADKLSKDEIEAIKKDKYDDGIEEMEKEFYIAVGKKDVENCSKKKKQDKSFTRIRINKDKGSKGIEDKPSWTNLLDKYASEEKDKK